MDHRKLVSVVRCPRCGVRLACPESIEGHLREACLVRALAARGLLPARTPGAVCGGDAPFMAVRPREEAV